MFKRFFSVGSCLLLLFVIALFPFNDSLAQEDRKPLELTFSETLVWESNLFHQPSGLELFGVIPKSGVIAVSRFQVDWNHASGMQAYELSANVDWLKYNNQSDLDRFEYRLAGRWKWEIPQDWSGTADLNFSSTQPSRSELAQAPSNLVDRREFTFTLNKSLNNQFQAQAKLDSNVRSNSVQAAKSANYRETTLETGLRYRPSPSFQSLISVRLIDGRYGYTPENYDVFTQKVIAWNAQSEVGSKGYLSGTLSYKWRSYDLRSERNFNGPSADISYRLPITDSILVNTKLGLATDTSGALDASYVKGKTLTIVSTWEASAKTRVDANLDFLRRDLRGSPSALRANRPLANEILNSQTVSVSHRVSHGLFFSAQLSSEALHSANVLRTFRGTSISLGVKLQM
jgi:hypothetical protein